MLNRRHANLAPRAGTRRFGFCEGIQVAASEDVPFYPIDLDEQSILFSSDLSGMMSGLPVVWNRNRGWTES